MGETTVRSARSRGDTKDARGKVYVTIDRCKGCGFCVEFCPTHVLEMAHEYNLKGYHYPLIVRPEACSGCDLCGVYCPDFAIYGVRNKKR